MKIKTQKIKPVMGALLVAIFLISIMAPIGIVLSKRVNEVKNDYYETAVNTVLVKNSTEGVLANDTATKVEPMGAAATQNLTQKKGTIQLNPNGSFTYIPPKDFSGIDAFRYKGFNDKGKFIGIGTVYILVGSFTNNPPVADNDTYYTNKDVTLYIPPPGILSNDYDPDNDLVEIILVSDVSHGKLDLDEHFGSFTYDPNKNFIGTDSFTYKLFDGKNYSNIATVTIIVSTSPPTVNLNIINPEATTYNTSTIPVLISHNATTVFYNVKNGTEWVFPSNQTYSGPTNMTGFVNGTYTFYAWATAPATAEDNVTFTVAIPEAPPPPPPPPPPPTVNLNIINPKNMTYTTGSIDVEISTNATTVFYNIKKGASWIYPNNETFNGNFTMGLTNGTYTLYVWATSPATAEKSVTFTVAIPAEGTSPPREETEEERQAREDAGTILDIISGGIIAGEEDLFNYDYNHDGVIDILDAFLRLYDAGLLPWPDYHFTPEAAQRYLALLEAQYGKDLVNYPTIDGRVYLLFILTYLPYVEVF